MRTSKAILYGLLAGSLLVGCQILPEPLRDASRRSASLQDNFIRAEGLQFVKNGKAYHFLGINFLHAAVMATSADGRKHLVSELNQLAELGVRNLRVLVPIESTLTAPAEVSVSFPLTQEQRLEGLDFLLAQLAEREMHAVLVLGRRLQSGPNDENNAAFKATLGRVIGRTNSLTGAQYRQDPTIMAWQLPAGVAGGTELAPDGYRAWLDATAEYIRLLDKNHMVSASGSEALIGAIDTSAAPNPSHAMDYLTFQLWPEAWGWFEGEFPEAAYAAAVVNAKAHILHNLQLAKNSKRPAVLEAFGIARDRGDHRSGVATAHRDDFFLDVLAMIETQARLGNAMAGANFSAMYGLDWRRQVELGEPQGVALNSVLDLEQSTLKSIKAHAEAINAISN